MKVLDIPYICVVGACWLALAGLLEAFHGLMWIKDKFEEPLDRWL